MSYVSNLQTENKLRKSKFSNATFKTLLMLLSSFIVLIIVAAFATIIINGVSEVNTNESVTWSDVFFGADFSSTGGVAFGMGILVINTIWMSFLVMLLAIPISVATAIVITRLLPKSLSASLIGVTSILAAIPSVIYGAFGYYVLNSVFNKMGIDSGSLLNTVIIVTIMVVPTITIMTTTSIDMVDKKMEESSQALGATKTQTSLFVTLRAAKSGIIVGALFALGRTLGEATAISMLSGASASTSGATFNIFKSSLFMAPAIMSAFNEPGDSSAVIYTILSSILLITVVIVFSLAKLFEYLNDDKTKAKKQSIKSVEISKITKKVNKDGFTSLTKKEDAMYASHLENSYYIEQEYERQIKELELYVVEPSTISAKSSYEKYKKRTSIMHRVWLVILAMISVVALISIIGYLFSDGFGLVFDWDYLSTKGLMDNTDYIGLGLPIFGTFATVVVSLSIAMPIGILIGTYSHVYLSRDSKLSYVLSFAFQIMTSIPAVIYGAIAVLIFAGTSLNESFIGFEPMIILSLVILPTIIKQTEEGLKSVNVSQEEGSYALGATKSYTSRRIFLKQALPAILSAAILASAILIAESAIFITILGAGSKNTDSTSQWIQDGGYTLSSQIFWLNNSEKSDAVNQQIKAIGIVIMIIILWMSSIGQLFRKEKNLEALILLLGIVLAVISTTTALFGFMIASWIMVIIVILLILFKDKVNVKMNYKKFDFKKWKIRL